MVTNSAWWWSGREQFRVTSVYDGDTFWLKSGDRVKLIGVNAPEVGRCLADEAKQKLTDLVLDKVIDLKEVKRDEWGRKMGLVYVDGETLVNLEIMKEGLAKPDYKANTHPH
jgi:endonuclease YncB( thermonuclease family)